MRWVIGRVAWGYGFITLPIAPQETAARAAALRSVLRALRSDDERAHIVGLSPEGTGSPVLREALPGTGELLLLAARTGAAIVPVGIAERPEHDWALTATVGAPLDLTLPPEITRAGRDQWARTVVMQSIARLLPRDVRGFYRDTHSRPGSGVRLPGSGRTSGKPKNRAMAASCAATTCGGQPWRAGGSNTASARGIRWGRQTTPRRGAVDRRVLPKRG